MSKPTQYNRNKTTWLEAKKKRLGFKQRKITHSLCMHINKDITSGVLLQKKSMENVSFMEPQLIEMITSVLGTSTMLQPISMLILQP